MSAVTRIARRRAVAAWTALLAAQLVLVVLTRSVSARLRDSEAEVGPEAGFTLVEWVVMVVIIAGAAAGVATLIYNWITNKAKGVTKQ
jgi:type II secretory pathway pseudopilin PulG